MKFGSRKANPLRETLLVNLDSRPGETIDEAPGAPYKVSENPQLFEDDALLQNASLVNACFSFLQETASHILSKGNVFDENQGRYIPDEVAFYTMDDGLKKQEFKIERILRTKEEGRKAVRAYGKDSPFFIEPGDSVAKYQFVGKTNGNDADENGEKYCIVDAEQNPSADTASQNLVMFTNQILSQIQEDTDGSESRAIYIKSKGHIEISNGRRREKTYVRISGTKTESGEYQCQMIVPKKWFNC